jgi:inner membrane protein involved in colicin E2 resistance
MVEQEQREMRKANPVKWFFLMLVSWAVVLFFIFILALAFYLGLTGY